MSKTTKAPKDSAYWKSLKAGLKNLFGKRRVKFTDLPTKKSGVKHGR